MEKSEWPDLNRHNLDPKSSALPNYATLRTLCNVAPWPSKMYPLPAYVLALLAWPLHTASCCDHTFSHALEPTDRFELSTYRLQGGCATTAPRWLNRPSAVSALFFVLLTDYPGFIIGGIWHQWVPNPHPEYAVRNCPSWNRTNESRSQSPVPYRLATGHCCGGIFPAAFVIYYNSIQLPRRFTAIICA